MSETAPLSQIAPLPKRPQTAIRQAVLSAVAIRIEGLKALADAVDCGSFHYGFSAGRRFARVWRSDGASRSVLAFVDLTSGDLHRADSWKQAGAPTGNSIFRRPITDGVVSVLAVSERAAAARPSDWSAGSGTPSPIS